MILTKEVEFNYDNQIFFKFQDIDLKSSENFLIIGKMFSDCTDICPVFITNYDLSIGIPN